MYSWICGYALSEEGREPSVTIIQKHILDDFPLCTKHSSNIWIKI